MGVSDSATFNGRRYSYDSATALLEDRHLCYLSWFDGGSGSFLDGHRVVTTLLTPDGEANLGRWTEDHPGGALGTFLDGELVSVDRYDFPLRKFIVIENIDDATAFELAYELGTSLAFHVNDGSPCRWWPEGGRPPMSQALPHLPGLAKPIDVQEAAEPTVSPATSPS